MFIIKNIFQPVYEHYINALSDSNQIDFTDAILQATEICRTSHPVEYDYIIVDEFQDISVDRYNFLKVLRGVILLQSCIVWVMIGSLFIVFREVLWLYSINSPNILEQRR